MKYIFWLVRLILKIFNLIPFSILYILSELLAPLLNHIIGYRKEIINTNLKNSFPQKSETEIKGIVKGFYRHLSDLIFEIIKLETLTENILNNRVTISGEEVLKNLTDRKKGVIIVMSHHGNWEWASQRVCFAGRNFDYIGVVAKEVSNPYFETFFTNLRLKLQNGNAEIIPLKQTARYLASVRHKASMIITIADQTPHKDQIQYRTSFLNQDSGVFLGPERIAKSLNFAVVFCHVFKTERGKYNIDFELITDNPNETVPFEITNRHVKLLEDDIIKQPETWLWSHRRWKY
jgi:KDO2-lipid IV(A) lauroyltransferase